MGVMAMPPRMPGAARHAGAGQPPGRPPWPAGARTISTSTAWPPARSSRPAPPSSTRARTSAWSASTPPCPSGVQPGQGRGCSCLSRMPPSSAASGAVSRRTAPRGGARGDQRQHRMVVFSLVGLITQRQAPAASAGQQRHHGATDTPSTASDDGGGPAGAGRRSAGAVWAGPGPARTARGQRGSTRRVRHRAGGARVVDHAREHRRRRRHGATMATGWRHGARPATARAAPIHAGIGQRPTRPRFAPAPSGCGGTSAAGCARRPRTAPRPWPAPPGTGLCPCSGQTAPPKPASPAIVPTSVQPTTLGRAAKRCTRWPRRGHGLSKAPLQAGSPADGRSHVPKSLPVHFSQILPSGSVRTLMPEQGSRLHIPRRVAERISHRRSAWLGRRAWRPRRTGVERSSGRCMAPAGAGPGGGCAAVHAASVVRRSASWNAR